MPKLTLRVPIQYIDREVTSAEFKLVYSLYAQKPKDTVTAIKFIREQYGLGLKEAKELCDCIAQSQFLANP